MFLNNWVKRLFDSVLKELSRVRESYHVLMYLSSISETSFVIKDGSWSGEDFGDVGGVDGFGLPCNRSLSHSVKASIDKGVVAFSVYFRSRQLNHVDTVMMIRDHSSGI